MKKPTRPAGSGRRPARGRAGESAQSRQARPAESERPAGDRARTVPPPPAGAAESLEALCEEGHLVDIDRHFAALVADLAAGLEGDGGPGLSLAAALASAWTRDGHACIALREVAGQDWPREGAVRLPDLDAWVESLGASPVVARPGDAERRPLVLDPRDRLYLDRLWRAEQAVASGLLRLATGPASTAGTGPGTGTGAGSEPAADGRCETDPGAGPDGLEAALDRLFPDTAPDDPTRRAARTAVHRRLCVISGGPGTGKTTIAAAVVALLIELRLAAPDRVALAAPTGKAAARLQEAVRGRHRELVSRLPVLEGFEARATTVHRWLNSNARDRVPVDALILDESSMVDLTLMASVLHALPDGARLVLLGDASQLASVRPGAVFADVCRAGTGDTGTLTPDDADPDAGGEGMVSADGEAAVSGADAGEARGTPGTGAGPMPSPPPPGDTDSTADGEGAVTDTETDTEDAPGPGRPGPGADPRGTASSPLAPCVVELVRNWRFDEAGGIGRLAAAVVRGDAEAAVAALRDPSDEATELRPLPDAGHFERLAESFADRHFAPMLEAIRAVREPGDMDGALLSSFRVLCAHRVGGFGAERFNWLVERRLRALGLVPAHDAFYPGRPILVTRNHPPTGLSNGDTGVVLCDADHRARVWFPELADAEGRPRLVAPARLPPHESFFAVTVHRAQGSEYEEVAVALGPVESRVATRELLYTAVTRARRRVVVHGPEESVRAALARATHRSSGLRDALGAGATSTSTTTSGRSMVKAKAKCSR